MKFQLKADFSPTGDQPEAIEKLTKGVLTGFSDQVLLGVTGSGKTFTVANVIQNVQKPTLVISHNKTLAAQLYQEFRDFFPGNAVSYFVSYYDYYQPEAYIPRTDTYIAKETEINEEIDKLRLAATANLLTRKDVIVIASVSCIYNLGSPKEYGRYILELSTNDSSVTREKIKKRLVELQYSRTNSELKRGTFRLTGEMMEIFPAYEDKIVRLKFTEETLGEINFFDPLTWKKLNDGQINATVIYPAKHYLADPKSYTAVFKKIRKDLVLRVKELKKEEKELEARRLSERVNYDLEMIKETGYVNGIENYSRYFDNREPGDPPFSLLDYFPKDYLLIIDESHMTIPQIGGMYRGDASRKKTLVDFGFRLPAAFDNRPLKFEEFLTRRGQTIYTSATPSEWETKRAKQVVEQVIRPTGLLDPEISIRPTENQIEDLIKEVKNCQETGERVLITTLTKRMSEDLANYLSEAGIKAHYLHSEVQTLDRQDILDNLRLGEYEAIVGINLLREGLDLPEVALVAILDADKEGFLRSETSLIQVMGRAARHINGRVIMYGDTITGSMRRAIEEVKRRREIQIQYNKAHDIVPKGIVKPIRGKLIAKKEEIFEEVNMDSLTPQEKKETARRLRKQMLSAAKDLDFERAGELRDEIKKLFS